MGGQAGSSSLIRNYLGFPSGVSGQELAVRAYTQAFSFGADYVYGSPASGLRPDGAELVVTLAGGTEVLAAARWSWPPAWPTGGSASRRWTRWPGRASSTARPARKPGP